MLLLLLLHPSLSQLSGTAALLIPASDTVRGGSKNQEHTERANEKNNPLATQAGAADPFPPRKAAAAAAAAAVTIETSPSNRFCRGTAADSRHKGGPRAEEQGRHPPRSPAANLERGLAARAAAPRHSAAPAPDLDSPGTPGAPAAPERRPTDRPTDGRTAAAAGTATADSRGAAAAPLRHNAAGPPAPLPWSPKGRARAGTALGASWPLAGAEGRGVHRGGRGRGRHCPGCWSSLALRRPRAGRPPPGPRAPLGRTDSAPPALPAAPPARRTPLPRRSLTPNTLLSRPRRSANLLFLPRVPFARLPRRRSRVLSWFPLPSYFSAFPSLSPTAPPAPTSRPYPLEAKSPLTVIRASAAATSLVPKPSRGPAETGQRDWEKGKTECGHCPGKRPRSRSFWRSSWPWHRVFCPQPCPPSLARPPLRTSPGSQGQVGSARKVLSSSVGAG